MAGIPDSVRHKFQRIIEESKGDQRFRNILALGKDENFKWAYEFAYDRAYGKAIQHVDMDLNDVTNKPTPEQLDAALRSIADHSKGNGVAQIQ